MEGPRSCKRPVRRSGLSGKRDREPQYTFASTLMRNDKFSRGPATDLGNEKLLTGRIYTSVLHFVQLLCPSACKINFARSSRFGIWQVSDRLADTCH